ALSSMEGRPWPAMSMPSALCSTSLGRRCAATAGGWTRAAGRGMVGARGAVRGKLLGGEKAMTFDDILDQVIALLKRQGRVSYGAMKRRFSLDDAYLEDLKGEILFAYPVVDEDGRGLVWTGDTTSAQAVISPPAQTTQPPVAQEHPSPQGAPLLTAPPLPDAARPQLTVMFCDVVDSTTLSGQLDPEEYRDVLQAYQAACVEAIQRFDGYI